MSVANCTSTLQRSSAASYGLKKKSTHREASHCQEVIRENSAYLATEICQHPHYYISVIS